MYGEAVIVFNPSLLQNDDGKHFILRYKHKQTMQLASKQRFMAIQFLTLLTEDLWKRSSEHSNAMAQLLKQRLESISTQGTTALIRITRPVETNAVFLEMPSDWYEPLSTMFPFYMWKTKSCEVRLMCSFDTTVDDIDRFINEIHELIKT